MSNNPNSGRKHAGLVKSLTHTVIQTFCAQSWWVTTGRGRRCRWPRLVCCLWPGTWSCPWFPERSPHATRSGSDPGWYQLERNQVRWSKDWIPLFHWFNDCLSHFLHSFSGHKEAGGVSYITHCVEEHGNTLFLVISSLQNIKKRHISEIK